MPSRLIMPLILSTLISLSLCAQASAERRVALVIGVNNYSKLSPLANPVRDAEELAKVLRANGVDVLDFYNPDFAGFHRALSDFSRKTEEADTAYVFYSGHGMEVLEKRQFVNALAPSDAEISCENRQAYNVVRLEDLLRVVAGAKNQVIIIDACRNDPLPGCTRGSGGYGFAPLNHPTNEGSAIMIGSSTLAGRYAVDGPKGSHSPYASALLRGLREAPNRLVRDILDDAAEAVEEATNGQQRPTIQSLGKTPRVCISGDNCMSTGPILARPKVAVTASVGQEPAKSGGLGQPLSSVPTKPN